MHGLRVKCLCLLFGVMPIFGSAAPPRAPFVSGFERFGVHEEITPLAAGELLLSELNCTACHAPLHPDLNPKQRLRLNSAGLRLAPEWIAEFLSAPHAAKPGTTMPDMFAGWTTEEKQPVIAALTAFLGSQREDFPEIPASGLNPVPFEFWKKGNPQTGRQLYHQIGCVACHEADPNYETADTKPSPVDQLLEQLDPQELKELGLAAQARRVESVPHSDLAAKYNRQSLTFFLLDPEITRPAGRMPNMKLKAVEAADIAAYLLRNQTEEPKLPAVNAPKDLIDNGRKLFTELKCNTCHEAVGVKPSDPSAKPIAQMLIADYGRGCLGSPVRGIPQYPLQDAQKKALRIALAAWTRNLFPRVETRLQTRLLKYNCYACHERDQQGGVGRYRRPYFETVGHVDMGDEGRLPPALTGVGSKLNKDWLKKVLQGQGDIRGHLRVRMPSFPNHAVIPMIPMFRAVDEGQRPPATEQAIFGKLDGLAAPGRVLLDNGCVQCHAFRGEALPGVVGVDLEGITRRVEPHWFHDFLLNPGQLKARTRMPTFFPNGVSQNKVVLAGDTERQIAAMWAYLKDLDKQPLPEKIEAARSQDYELKPTDRPIVLRTFMQEAGTHAIAVGFPQGVHFAFDAESVRLAAIWRGKFLDAQGTWFSRFTPPADPLGDDLVLMPAGLPLAMLDDAKAGWPKVDPQNPPYRYLGYRLDDAGVPTFLYRYETFDIEDRIAAKDKRSIQRQLTITPSNPDPSPRKLWFRPIAGKTLTFDGNGSCTNERGLSVKLAPDTAKAGQHRKLDQAEDWVIPLPNKNRQSIEWDYQWLPVRE